MKLSEIFAQLSYGELSQLTWGNSGSGVIDEADYARLLAPINLGLAALYKRFPLKEGRATFLLEAGKGVYAMNSMSDVTFVDDGTDFFADDVLKIEKVETLEGVELGLNDASDPYGCTTPTLTTLRVPLAIAAQDSSVPAQLKTTALTIVYRANHPILTKTGASFNPSRVEVELPYAYLEGLLFFVASRVHNPIGMTNEFHMGNSYYAKYEKFCADMELKNVMIDQGSQNTQLERNGWV